MSNKPEEEVQSNTASMMIATGEHELREGDLVLRLSVDPASQFIRLFNRKDKRYSHAGIVLMHSGYPYIYHILTGDENPDGKIRKDSLSKFAAAGKNFGFAIYRYEMTKKEITNVKSIIKNWIKRGVTFDMAFDLRTNDRMYCSEMIMKALREATFNRINIKTTQPTAAEASFIAEQLHLSADYWKTNSAVAIDNLFLSGHCKQILSFNYPLYQSR